MNKCAELATGEYLSFLDNDDEIQENLFFVAKLSIKMQSLIISIQTKIKLIQKAGQKFTISLIIHRILITTVMYFTFYSIHKKAYFKS